MEYADGQNETYYFSQVLGHQENSLQVSLSYQKFAIRRRIQENDPDLASKVTTLQEEIRAVKKYSESLKESLLHAQSINRRSSDMVT